MSKIIIASMPRSGSTYLFRCVAGLKHRNTTPKDKFYWISGYTCPSVEVDGNYVIKTHLPYDVWEKDLDLEDKTIYLYSDPVDAVISTKLKRNEFNHFFNCGYEGEMKDIYKEDFLGYENTFDSWMKSPGLKINYDYLFECREEIEEYLGFKIKWNKWNPRTTNKDKVTEAELEQIKSTYDSLIKKVVLL